MKSMRRWSALCIAPLLLAGAAAAVQSSADQEHARPRPGDAARKHVEEKTVHVEYLEIVTPSVNETCDALAQAHGVAFSEPVAALGGARTASLKDGGRIGVRAPMHDGEKPVVRPYVLVNDIDAAVKAAEAAGGMVMVPSMPIPGQGTIALYNLGGIEHGLWQN